MKKPLGIRNERKTKTIHNRTLGPHQLAATAEEKGRDVRFASNCGGADGRARARTRSGAKPACCACCERR